jgi:hypothetical protein
MSTNGKIYILQERDIRRIKNMIRATRIAMQTIFEARQIPTENRIHEVDSLYQLTDEVLWDYGKAKDPLQEIF